MPQSSQNKINLLTSLATNLHLHQLNKATRLARYPKTKILRLLISSTRTHRHSQSRKLIIRYIISLHRPQMIPSIVHNSIQINSSHNKQLICNMSRLMRKKKSSMSVDYKIEMLSFLQTFKSNWMSKCNWMLQWVTKLSRRCQILWIWQHHKIIQWLWTTRMLSKRCWAKKMYKCSKQNQRAGSTKPTNRNCTTLNPTQIWAMSLRFR